MQDSGFDFPRIPLLGTSVNKSLARSGRCPNSRRRPVQLAGMKRAGAVIDPGPRIRVVVAISRAACSLKALGPGRTGQLRVPTRPPIGGTFRAG
jgi:hypothetical protein